VERDTNQRRAIRHALINGERPMSPQEVWDAARVQEPRLGIATVYRTLKSLVEDGWVVTVNLLREAPRYEVAGKAHHHHFMCRACGRVYELHGCPGNLKQLVPRGFRMEEHEVVLYGVCKHCSAAS
jgi:Fur family ferric uptake transcriptional regulator